MKIEIMSWQDALHLMMRAESIHDWNQKRQIVKYNVDPEQRTTILNALDAQKLCPHVAKLNHWSKPVKTKSTIYGKNSKTN